MRNLLSVLFLGLIMGCSPLNNRYHEEDRATDKPEKTTQSSPLKVNATTSYTVEHQWVRGPFENIHEPSELLVFVYDDLGRLTALPKDVTLSFFATMPSMGHPLDQPGYFRELTPGIYLNSEISFNMPGDWKMELSVLDQNYKELDKVIWLTVF